MAQLDPIVAFSAEEVPAPRGGPLPVAETAPPIRWGLALAPLLICGLLGAGLWAYVRNHVHIPKHLNIAIPNFNPPNVGPTGAPTGVPPGLLASELRPVAIRRAARRLRHYGALRTLTVTPYSVSATVVRHRRQRLVFVTAGGVRAAAASPAPPGATLSWRRVDPHAPARIARRAHVRLGRITTASLSGVNGTPRWTVTLRSGRIWTAGPHGRYAKRIG